MQVYSVLHDYNVIKRLVIAQNSKEKSKKQQNSILFHTFAVPNFNFLEFKTNKEQLTITLKI